MVDPFEVLRRLHVARVCTVAAVAASSQPETQRQPLYTRRTVPQVERDSRTVQEVVDDVLLDRVQGTS